MKKKVLIGLAVLPFLGASALAFSGSVATGLESHGYTEKNSYTYTKNTGTCHITVTQSNTNKFYVKGNGVYSTGIWPVPASQVVNAAVLVENICS